MNSADFSRPDARAKIHQAALKLYAQRGGGGISVSDLADAAGIARGTIYNNIDNPETLFGDIADSLAGEMVARTEATMAGIEDPPTRLAIGMRLFVRRAHEEPDWGRFIIRFTLTHDALQSMMDKPPARDIARAIADRRFKVEPAMLNAMASLLVGAMLGSMSAVLSGHQTWRDAGSNAAELFLRAGGLAAGEARRIARAELPPLSPRPGAKPRAEKGKRK